MRALIAVILLSVIYLLCGCQRQAVRVMLDGVEYQSGDQISDSTGDDLRVYITLDGRALIDLPFDEVHTVDILQANGSENTVSLDGSRVLMAHANCENQDCVEMGAVTRDNLELRVMGGFIICLPHKVSVEVR